MALRVLLADESPTIKKVFQLALQDFAVDVTSVGMGPDVVQVLRQFKPDIVFCDILLQKRNGYDVCAEIKNDANLKNTPVILMWSAFMELDEDKMQAARADGNLQKPFEVQDLRNLVNQHVSKTRSQRLGQFLNFPKMPEMVDSQPPQLNSDGSLDQASAPASSWNMESFDPIPTPEAPLDSAEDFQEVPLPPAAKPDEDLVTPDEAEEGEMEWSTKSLGRFQVGPQNLNDEMILDVPDEQEEALDLEVEVEDEVTAAAAPQPAAPQPAAPASRPTAPAPPPRQTAPQQPAPQPAAIATPVLTEAQLEKIIREQVQGMIEAIAWKVVPDLATQIIERELKRLLDEKTP